MTKGQAQRFLDESLDSTGAFSLNVRRQIKRIGDSWYPVIHYIQKHVYEPIEVYRIYGNPKTQFVGFKRFDHADFEDHIRKL